MTVKELSSKLGLEIAAEGPDREISKPFCCDLLSVAMARAPCDCAWVTVIGNANVVAVATLTDASCVIIAEGYTYDQAAIDAAAGKVTLLRSSEPTFDVAQKIGSML